VSGAPALPPGWKHWPEEQLAALLTELEALANERSSGRGPWRCDVPGCDGEPHPGRRNRHARAEQLPPADPDWDYWALLAGRGFGKTRTGAEWVIEEAKHHERGALVGPTAADVRDIMVEGESGILACARRSFRPEYQPSKRRLVYPNGAIQVCYSADEPDRLRGPQHHYGWADELAAWRYYRYAWDMLMMGMRLGDHPRICITTTPRPIDLIKELNKDERCRVVKGSTYANLKNLAPTFTRTVLDRYAGTVLGRQELDAEILEDMPGALVRRRHIDAARVSEAPELDMVIVGVDPAGTGTGDEAGLIVVGREARQVDDQGVTVNPSTVGHAYVLADLSGLLTARQTGIRAWGALYEWNAQVLVYEDNFGKQWLRNGLIDSFADYHSLTQEERDAIHSEDAEDGGAVQIQVFDKDTGEELEVKTIPNPWKYLRKVTAQDGKTLRAQPVAMRYEQGRVHHVGQLEKLEDQLTTWNPHSDVAKERNSPDRVDALVHAITHMLKRERSGGTISAPHARGIGGATGRPSGHPLLRGRR
jgi:phage terminase large subunit-like protein